MVTRHRIDYEDDSTQQDIIAAHRFIPHETSTSMLDRKTVNNSLDFSGNYALDFNNAVAKQKPAKQVVKQTKDSAKIKASMTLSSFVTSHNDSRKKRTIALQPISSPDSRQASSATFSPILSSKKKVYHPMVKQEDLSNKGRNHQQQHVIEEQQSSSSQLLQTSPSNKAGGDTTTIIGIESPQCHSSLDQRVNGSSIAIKIQKTTNEVPYQQRLLTPVRLYSSSLRNTPPTSPPLSLIRMIPNHKEGPAVFSPVERKRINPMTTTPFSDTKRSNSGLSSPQFHVKVLNATISGDSRVNQRNGCSTPLEKPVPLLLNTRKPIP